MDSRKIKEQFEHPARPSGSGVRRPVVSLGVVLACGGAVVAASLLVGCSRGEPAVSPPVARQSPPADLSYQPPSDDGYVGSSICAGCHSDIAESYKTHPMSRSIVAIDPNSDEAGFSPVETRVVGKQRIHEVELRDGRMFHHEKMFDAAGELIYDHAVPMDYVVGSGRRAKAYLYRRGELLFMSPLNWYSQAQRWDPAPGYVADDPRRFDRRITDECLSCHAGRVAPTGRSLNRYAEPVFHETAIGCENCHGPGRQHVALHESGLWDGTESDPIVHPADLDHDRREAVCYQCHLQAAVRLPRYGRSDFDFRPGQRLDEIWTVLDARSGVADDGRSRAVSHVQQMRESRCYTASDGRLGCTSCHDPHGVPSQAEREVFYRERCYTCHGDSACSLPHEQRLESNNSCIACHMPRRDASNISHVTQTDHRIVLRIEPTPGSDADPSSDGLSFFDAMHQRLEPWERDRALGLGAWLYLTGSGRRPSAALAGLLRRVLEKRPRDGAVLTVLASMALDNQLTKEARRHYEAARDFPDAEEAALLGLLKIAYLAADWQNAIACADRLLEIDPGNASAHAMRADALAALGRPTEGIESARRALEFNPTLIAVREWLVEAYRKSGLVEEQRAQQQILRRLRDARPPPR